MESIDLSDLSPDVEPAKRLRVAVHEAGHALVRSALFGLPDIIEITGDTQPEHPLHWGAMRPGPPRDGLPKVVSNTSDQDQFVHVAMVYLAGPAAVRLFDPRLHELPHGEVEEDPGEIGGEDDECFAHDVCWEGAGGDQLLDGLKSKPELYERALQETDALLRRHQPALRRLALALHRTGSLSAGLISEILLAESGTVSPNPRTSNA